VKRLAVLLFLALLAAPLTVVQPCLAAGLLLLLAIGTHVLHERVGRREIISIRRRRIAIKDPDRLAKEVRF